MLKDKAQFIGRLGEDLACEWLIARGHKILHRNWRAPNRHDAHGELDIATRCADVVHLVEVRARRGTAHGTPEETITSRKQTQLRAIAAAYIHAQQLHNAHVQIDVLAIELDARNTIRRIELLENVFA